MRDFRIGPSEDVANLSGNGLAQWSGSVLTQYPPGALVCGKHWIQVVAAVAKLVSEARSKHRPSVSAGVLGGEKVPSRPHSVDSVELRRGIIS